MGKFSNINSKIKNNYFDAKNVCIFKTSLQILKSVIAYKNLYLQVADRY